MDSSDILSVIMDFLVEDEDADSLHSCRLVCRKFKNVIDKYPSKYANMPFMKIAKLINSDIGITTFRKSLLDLLLVQTAISPIIGDTWGLIRFLQISDRHVNMENALDRLVPDSTKLGNDHSYEPTQELFIHVLISYMAWLNHWYLWNSANNLPLTTLNDMFANLNTKDYWLILEEKLDELFRLLAKYKFQGDSSKLDWEIDYDYYSLYSTCNETYPNKIELLLNKLKIIYQMTNIPHL
jgi:hypothetical protein